MFMDEFTLRSMIKLTENTPIHRDYDAEWMFIRLMDHIGEYYKLGFSVVINKDNENWVGVPGFFEEQRKSENDNALQCI